MRYFSAIHRVTYWVSYQPADCYSYRQGADGVVLLVLGAIATTDVVRRLRHPI